MQFLAYPVTKLELKMSSSRRISFQELLSSCHYEEPLLTKTNFRKAIKKYPDLEFKFSRFEVNDGNRTRIRLICLRGRIPVPIHWKWTTPIINIPVVIWLQTGFPVDPPLVFLTPMEEPLYGGPKHPFVDPHGEVDLLELMGNLKLYGLWEYSGLRQCSSSSLSDWISFLIQALSRWPPIHFLPPIGSPLLVEEATNSSNLKPSGLPKNTLGARKLKELEYLHPDKTATDVRRTIEHFPNLKRYLKGFLYNSGQRTRKVLLTLCGTLRIVSKRVSPCHSAWLPPHVSKGQSYDVPVLIWIPQEYPLKDPIVFVEKSTFLCVHQNRNFGTSYFDADGRINLFKAIRWGSAGRRGSLKRLICQLVRKFSTSLDLGDRTYEVMQDSSSEEFSDEEDPHPCQEFKANAFLSALKRDGYRTNANASKPCRIVMDGISGADKEILKVGPKVEISTKTAILSCDAAIQTDAPESNLPAAPVSNALVNAVHMKCSSAANSQRLDLFRGEIAMSDIKVESLEELMEKIEERVIRLESQEQKPPFAPSLFEEEFVFIKSKSPPEQNVCTEPDGEGSVNSSVPTKLGNCTSLNVPICQLPRTFNVQVGILLAEAEGTSVNICWTKCLSTNEAILACGILNCNFSRPFGSTTEKMNATYEQLVNHVQINHKVEAALMAQRIGKKPTFKCSHFPVCKLLFADENSRCRHEVSHRQFSLRGRWLPTKNTSNVEGCRKRKRNGRGVSSGKKPRSE